MKLEELVNSYSICLISDNMNTSGTGFCATYNGKLYLITDCHVVYNRDQDRWYSDNYVLKFLNQSTDLTSQPLFRLYMNVTQCYKSEELDLCVIELTKDNTNRESGCIEIVDVDSFDLGTVDISPRWARTVYFCGVPSSLHIEAPFDSKPIISKGIISAYDEVDGRFVTDIPVYYGNSGSPAFDIAGDGTIILLGIVQKLVQFNLEWKNRFEHDMKRMDWHNSGYSICRSVNKIIELITTGYASGK